MTHRAENILKAVEDKMNVLFETLYEVQRDRLHPPERYPALSITQGSETPVETLSSGFQDALLAISINIYVKELDYSTRLNKIKAEVYNAMLKDHTLGLSYVIDTTWEGDEAPELISELEQGALVCSMNFVCQYRHSYISKES